MGAVSTPWNTLALGQFVKYPAFWDALFALTRPLYGEKMSPTVLHREISTVYNPLGGYL